MHERGFTLIELLVSIVVVGLLAAISYPAYLSQVGKARESEAKQILGSINRAQQAYVHEHQAVTNDLSLLDVEFEPTNYQYEVYSSGELVTVHAQPLLDLHGYAGVASLIQHGAGLRIGTILCRAQTRNTPSTALGVLDGTELKCPVGFDLVG